MPLADPDRDPVDLLAEEFAERFRRGERPSVGEYAERHPEHADQLRDLLPAVAQMEQLKQLRRVATAEPEESPPDRLGDFRIVREVGRGGMGVVFEAVQESLGRRVALKLLSRHAQLDAARRERFLREAQAAARLHHTNIVPVFGVGEQDGLPYYVMQLIPGRSLHELICLWRNDDGASFDRRTTAPINDAMAETRRTPNPAPVPCDFPPPRFGDWAFVARIGAEVADAVAYAHEEGVLHRDIKPGNLILDEHDRVWVTDFGLAKMSEHAGLTASGDVVGTLQYLAPECLAGAGGAASDVYSLGASLYELATLEPPFDAVTPAGLVKQITTTEPRPPRQLNPAVPRDLETIILKAMAREPSHRYATAGDLADDLRAFLDDRPIRARRLSWVARAWRVCRRHPTVTVLSAVTAAALLVATAVGWLSFGRAQTAFEQEEKLRKDAEASKEKLEANLNLSLDAIEKMFQAAAPEREFMMLVGPPRPNGPDRGPGGPPLPMMMESSDKAELLESILAFYDRFAEQNSTNPKLQFDAAKAYRRVGQLRTWLNQTDAALAACRRSAAILDDLHRQFPENPEFAAELAKTLAQTPLTGNRADDDRRLQRAMDLARSVATNPDFARVAGPIADGLFIDGFSQEITKDYAGAEKRYRAALEWYPQGRRGPEAEMQAFGRIVTRIRLAAVLVAQRNPTEARDLLDATLRDLDPVGGGRHQFGPPGLLGDQLGEIASLLDQAGDPETAARVRERAKAFMGPRGFGGGKQGKPFDPGPPPKFPKKGPGE
jgi:tetratricopeptide (TPR) repeat protein